MKTTKEMIEVMQAFENGKEIEYFGEIFGIWMPTPAPCWNWVNYDYRIKPEVKGPTYRPYESVEEMIADFKNRVNRFTDLSENEMPLIWVQDKLTSSKCLITMFDVTEVEGVWIINDWLNMNGLFEEYTYLDGTPVGKLVEE